MRRIALTGGCGFIGSHLARALLAEPDVEALCNLDARTYAGRPENVADLAGDPRYTFVHGDVADPAAAERAIVAFGATHVVNCAAETHVDRSIEGGQAFLTTNVQGTFTLLEAARRAGVARFLQVSTDEVYGSRPDGHFTEADRLTPSSPYSAAKAGGDLVALSYGTTYGLDVVLTRCSNNYGPNQFPEKVIPLFVTNLLDGRRVPVYGDGRQVRDWLFVGDHVRAVQAVLAGGAAGEVYNVGGGFECQNLELVERLCALVGVDVADAVEHVADRPGHDRRYAVDTARIRALGWSPQVGIDDGLARTVAWYRDHRDWWEPLRRAEPSRRGLIGS